jgi:deoxyribose-phosphate aldolase
MMTKKQLAKLIDHTLLKPDATKDDIIHLCKEAKKHSFWSVCVNPTYVSLATKILRGSDVKICTVVGFPLGANVSEVKAFETGKTIHDGASEIDMVMNIGALKSHDYELINQDIRKVVERAKAIRKDAVVKVIIETGLLTEDEKVLACRFVKEAGADFVKTSTGLNTSGATVHDVKLIRNTVGPDFGVKASGGIRTYRDAIALVKAGANRIGTSSGVAIIGQN